MPINNETRKKMIRKTLKSRNIEIRGFRSTAAMIALTAVAFTFAQLYCDIGPALFILH